ncbi:MAG TPA: ComF family protein [Clostridia bacterium]|jgi:ComF family protein|nr:ComF family protein [Clostridia bacterium]
MNLFSDLLDLFFPKLVCLLCGQAAKINFGGLCEQCYAGLPKIGGEKCAICGRPLLGNRCFSCGEEEYFFKLNRSWGLYKGKLKEGIYKFKYGNKPELGRVFANLMVQTLLEEKQYGALDLILGVPLHSSKLKERGYNQADLLANFLAKQLNLDFAPNVLVRTRNTLSQSRLNKKERERNLVNAFVVNKKNFVSKRVILLIDDVFTTGATVNACAQTLLQAGSKEVFVLTLAAGELSKND